MKQKHLEESERTQELEVEFKNGHECPDCKYFVGCETARGGRVCFAYTKGEKK